MPLDGLPAHGAKTPENEQLKLDTPLLTTMESIKLEGRPVLCLEVEADAYAAPAEPADVGLLRCVDMLLAVTVLLVCVVGGNVSADVTNTGLTLAAALAAVAGAGALLYNLKAPAQSFLHRMALDAAGALVLAAYFPVALWEGEAHLYLPASATAAVAVPWQVAQRYLACVDALDEQGLGDETPRALFCNCNFSQQQQEQEQASSARQSVFSLAASCLQRLALDAAGAVVLAAYFPVAVWEGEAHVYLQQLPFVTAATEAVLVYWTAVQWYLACLDAIAEIGEKEPCALFPETNNEYHHQQQQGDSEAAALSAFSRVQAGLYRLVLDVAGAVGQLAGADADASDSNTYTAAEQKEVTLSGGHATAAGSSTARPSLLQCLTAIGQLGGDDTVDTLVTHLQQGGAPPSAKAAPATHSGAAAAGWRSPFESAQGLMHCVTAVGHLAADME